MDPATVGMAMGGAQMGMGIISNAQNMKMQKQTNAHNQAMAREQMAFQERMSSTAHQRATKDLELAGLNRILSVTQGGASAPSGASSTAIAPQSKAADALKDGINSGMAAYNMQADLAIKEATVARTLAETAQSIELHPSRLSSAKSQAHQDFSGRYIKTAEAQSAGERAKQSQLATKRDTADTPRAIDQSKLDREYMKVEKPLKIIKDAAGIAASSAATLSRRGTLQSGYKPPTIRAGSARETRELLKAGKKGLEVKYND